MDLWLQIALGLLPVIGVLVVCLVTKKMKKRRAIPLLSLFLAGALVCTGLFAAGQWERRKSSGAAERPEAEGLSMVYAVAEEGDTRRAQSLLRDLRERCDDGAALTLCAARLYALEGRLSAARTLYEKLGASLTEAQRKAEYDPIVAAVTAAAGTDPVLLRHGSGGAVLPEGDPDAREEAHDAAEDAVDAAIEAGGEGAWAEAARYMTQTDDLYERYLAGEDLERGDAKKLEKKLDALCQEQPELMAVEALRLARLKTRVLNEDFKAIARDVGSGASHDELLVASELYLNKYIKKSSFSEEYGQAHAQECAVVRQQLEEVYSGAYARENKSARNKMKRYIKELEFSEKNPALAQMKNDMLAYAGEKTAADSSKVYLQLSKIEDHMGNFTAAEQYLSASLDTVSTCADGSFTQPMYSIIGIVADKEDPERLKDVAGYVDKILTNTATIPMPTALYTTAAGEEAPEAGDYSTRVTDSLSKKTTAVNIISVDASRFETVTATVSIDGEAAFTAEELKARLALRDCGAAIEDFTVEKVEYTGANVLLCCDTSGSMDGEPIESLRAAVRLFVENQEQGEQIALITFSSMEEMALGFGTTDAELLSAADGLAANGGTNMYGAVLGSMGQFKKTENAINVVVLLSDGADNEPRTIAEIYSEVGASALEKGVVIYAVGLGSGADATYLSHFAGATGGSYLYANDSKTLGSFFSFLSSQMFNQYKITFKARDTLSMGRKLRVALTGDDLTYDECRYYLPGGETAPGEGDTAEDIPVMQGKTVSGLETRLLMKGHRATQIKLFGSGFAEKDAASFALKGNLDYDIEGVFVDENTYTLTIPGGVACDSYALHVTIGGKTAILDRELTVAVPGQEKTVRFGPYVFTAYSGAREGDIMRLSGQVCMNGWLQFRGDVTLQGLGAADTATITLCDEEGSSIRYYPGTSEGLAKFMGEHNMSLPLPPLGAVTLHNDPTRDAGDEDYPVEPKLLPALYVSNLVTLASPGLALYPDRIQVDANEFSTDFPMQDKLVQASGVSPFKFTHEFKMLLTDKNIGVDMELKLEDNREDDEKAKLKSLVNFGATPLACNLGEGEVKINTIENKYAVKLIVGLSFLNIDGLGFSLNWDGNLVPSEVHLYADFEVTASVSGVPITFSDFKLGLKEIDPKVDPLKWTLMGGATASVAKLSSVFGAEICDWLGDPSIASFDDAKLELSIGKAHIKFSTDFLILNKIKLAQIELEAGSMKYSNALLGMDKENALGLRGKYTQGLMWEEENCDINLTGAMELALTNKAIGATVEGNCGVDVRWWVLTHQFEVKGTAFLGVFVDHSGDIVFTVRASGYNSKGKSDYVAVSCSQKQGLYMTTEAL
ncbi:MAG: vWA domain-containing protein [Pseudoflavonifractor sp.]